MFIRTLPIFVALFLCSCASTYSKKELNGRWISGEGTESYVVDRYADGRYAEKQFFSIDLNKPSEIVLNWGRWNIRGKKYFYIIDGSTSDSMKRFAGKWRDLNITSISQNRFSFESSDAHPMFETKTYSRIPLPDVPVGVPEKPDFKDAIYVKQFSTNSFTNAPSWVNENSVD